jgi:eukaryotic-like serine/threonine-protein kinase
LSIEPETVLLKRYRVRRHLRREGLGDVFAAEDTSGGEHVAVKALGAPREHMTQTEAAARFRREAKVFKSMRGDYLLRSIEAGEDAEHGLVIVYELREGELLSNRLRDRGPMQLDALFPLVEQLWSALADLHGLGIVHRDVRSANLLLDQGPNGERLTLINFGSCKLPPSQAEEDELTQHGQILGDLRFISPEQIGESKAVDVRTDIYGGMSVVFHAITGEYPFASLNPLMLVDLKHRTAPRRIGQLTVPPVDRQLESFVARGLANTPDRRFATSAEALEAWRALRP